MGSGWLLDTTVDFGESPCGCPWGANTVHNMGAAQRAMRKATLVVAVGTSLSILANYFDPWVHSSPPPHPANPTPTQPNPPRPWLVCRTRTRSGRRCLTRTGSLWKAGMVRSETPPRSSQSGPRQSGRAGGDASWPSSTRYQPTITHRQHTPPPRNMNQQRRGTEDGRCPSCCPSHGSSP